MSTDSQISLTGGLVGLGIVGGAFLGFANTDGENLSKVLYFALAGGGFGLLAARILHLAGAILVDTIVLGVLVFAFWERLGALLPGELPPLASAAPTSSVPSMRSHPSNASPALLNDCPLPKNGEEVTFFEYLDWIVRTKRFTPEMSDRRIAAEM